MDNHYEPLATDGDAIREWVWNVGRERPDVAWLVTNYDTVERNPWYVGPPVPHPDDFVEE